MKVQQGLWTAASGWQGLTETETAPTIILVFGSRAVLESGQAVASLPRSMPKERCFGCSTAGEIEQANVHDGTVVATAVWLERSSVETACVSLSDGKDSFELGQLLGRKSQWSNLVHALVLSDGTKVNGSELTRGLTSTLPTGATITGGLSGDGAEMKQTVVLHAGEARTGCITVLGFRGAVRVGTGSMGGWDAFGPKRVVTKSHGNVLEELDGEKALTLYKRYLGHHASELPSSALLFPLMINLGEGHAPVVRTVLAVDEASGTMTFAGDIPVASTAQLMRANFERIIQAGEGAASLSLTGQPPDFAVLISCVGRKLILKQRVEEEVEAVRSVLGANVVTTGFYSYGELAPQTPNAPCQLHNQTMTITTFHEV